MIGRIITAWLSRVVVADRARAAREGREAQSALRDRMTARLRADAGLPPFPFDRKDGAQ
jgi:hypothetical protein